MATSLPIPKADTPVLADDRHTLNEVYRRYLLSLPSPNGWNTYTPILTKVANVTTASVTPAQYLQQGRVLTVSGQVTVTPTAATTFTQLGMTLPVGSPLAFAYQCAGVAVTSDVAGSSASIVGDVTHSRAEVQFTTGADVAAHTWAYQYTYLVVS